MWWGRGRNATGFSVWGAFEKSLALVRHRENNFNIEILFVTRNEQKKSIEFLINNYFSRFLRAVVQRHCSIFVKYLLKYLLAVNSFGKIGSKS